MKKALIVSDSHGRFDLLLQMMEIEKPDFVFAMGDYSKDAQDLAYAYESIPFFRVKGNCDFWDRSTDEETVIELAGQKILLTHGHLYGVKHSYHSLEQRAKQLGVDFAFFGHTHKSYLSMDKPILFNPGAAEDGKYGMMYIDKNIEIEMKSL